MSLESAPTDDDNGEAEQAAARARQAVQQTLGAIQIGDSDPAPYLSGQDFSKIEIPSSDLPGSHAGRPMPGGGRYARPIAPKQWTAPPLTASRKELLGAISDAAKQSSLHVVGVSTVDALTAISAHESGLRPDALNPGGAAGAFQFMPGTWAQTTSELGMSENASPFDPVSASRAGAHFAERNAAFLESRGVPVTLANLYTTHRFGQGGASTLFHANRNQPIAEAMPVLNKISKSGESFLKLNGFDQNTTVGDALDQSARFMDRALKIAQQSRAQMDAGSSVEVTGSQKGIDSYSGMKAKQAAVVAGENADVDKGMAGVPKPAAIAQQGGKKFGSNLGMSIVPGIKGPMGPLGDA
jgi:hypothetical protein